MTDILSRFRQAVDAKLQQIWDAPPPFPLRASTALANDFVAPAIALSTGGKRTRALFALAGFQAGCGASPAVLDTLPTAELPVSLGAALELYQLSALIHDDVIDGAATRRGIATAHVAYATWHGEHHLLGSKRDFGEKMALLLGDYVLSLAAYTLEQSLTANTHLALDGTHHVRALFHSMCAEVAFGQYTDALSEFQPLEDSSAAATNQALTVLYHKAARYSVLVPTLLGAEFAMALRSHRPGTSPASTDATLASPDGIPTPPLSAAPTPYRTTPPPLTDTFTTCPPQSDASIVAELERICRPLGEAFQLRDDVLGIFGDPQITGKPAGDDLSEGKRTVLLALTRAAAQPRERAIIDSLIGRPLSEKDLATARSIIQNSGAYEQHEAMIAERETAVAARMQASGLELSVLAQLAGNLAQRTY